MNKIVLLIALIVGCRGAVRDSRVYQSELSFIREINAQQVRSLKNFIKDKCDCQSLTPDCSRAVNVLMVSELRVPWHIDMMAANGGVGSKVGEPPALPSGINYCEGL